MENPIHVIRGGLTDDAPLNTAVSRAILARVGSGELPETLEVGTPHRTIAFGKHDSLSKGFGDAAGIATRHGYDTTIRIAGGRAVAFSPEIVRFAWTLPVENPAASMHARFAELAAAVVSSLGDLGVEASVGEVPGEYCAGDYSVHVLGARKVMGVGQRLSRTAAQVGGMIVMSDPDAINEVLVPVYRALGVTMDPAATGAVADVAELSADSVMDALALALAAGRPIVHASVDTETRRLADGFREQHAVHGT